MYYQKNQQKKEQIMETPAISMLKKDVEYEQGEITSLEYSRLTLDVPDMNILKWDIKDSTLDDILKNDPSHRKNFLINISIYYNSTNYFHLIYPDHYYNSSKILINHFQAHLSADDISLMLATYNKQMNEYWENSVSLLENLDKIMSKMPNKFKIEPFTFDNPQDEEEINEYKQVFCVENAEILFLNDLKGTKSLTPFLKLIFKIDPFSIESIVASKKAMSCYFEIFLLFYNPFSNKTEPMIEKTPFFIELVKRPEGVYYLNLQLYDQKKIFNQLSNKSPMLNINITEDMLSVFFKVKTSWEEKLWDGQDFENVNKQPINSNDQLAKSPTKKNERLQSHHKKFISSKFANSYTIKNESGYTLRIRKHERNRNFSINKEKIKRNNLDDHKNFLEIKDGESKEYEIEANTNFFEENFCQPVKIYLEFLSYSKTLYYIQDISINRLRMQLKSWNSKKLTKDNLQNKFFMCNVKMKETKSKLNITSPITFFNRTSKSVQITIISEEYAESLIYVIPPLKKKPIPLEYAENQSLFSLKFQLAQEKANFSEKVFTFWSLKTTQGSKGFEGKQGNDFFYLIRGKLITGDKNPRIYKLDIFIESLFSITNSLPLPLEVEFFTKSIKEDNYFPSIKLSCQESYLYELSTINSPVFMHIQLSGLQKSEDIMVFSENMTKKNQKIPLFSELKTDKNEPVNIFMFCQSDGIKVHSIFIYAKGCIINETKEELLFYSVKSLGQQVEFLNKFKLSKNLMPGQTIESSYQILLFDETTEIAIAHKDCPNELSNNISITGSGVVKTAEIKVLNEKEELKKEEKMTELYEFAINISSKCSVHLIDEKKQHFYIFTKIVEVSPKYILVNNTQRKLEISQENALKSFRISANERKPFYWKDNEKMKLMIIRLDESGVDWNWSGGIDVSIPKTFTFLIRGRPFSQSEKKDEISFFRVLIFKEKEIHYISIYCLQQEDYPYRLQNNCKNFTIAFKQIEEDLNVINKVSNNIPFVIMNNSSLPFAWPFPNKPSEIEISFFHQGLFDPIPFRINFNLTRLTHKIRKFQIPTRSLMYEIEAKYIVNGPTIILEFTDKNINIKQEEESEVVIKCFVLFFKEFGISLITKNKLQKNIELCYIYLKDFELLLLEETNYKTFQLRIKYLNIDNNSKYDAYHPVILTPSLKRRYLEEANSHYCLDVIVKYNDKLDQLTWLHSVEIHIMPFTIRLEEDFFDIAFELYHRLLKLSENKPDYYKEIKKSKIPLINILFMAIDKKHRKTKSLHKAQSNRSYDWEWFVIPESKSLYINEITLPAIDFNFTLNRKNLALDDFSLIKTIAEIFGTTFTNVNDAPIQMKGLKVRYIFDSKKGVLDRFLFHYRENLISTILKIIGSINIIGNPIGLARYIGSGFVDLIEKPIEGIQRGPLGLGIGIYEGSSSF